MNDVEIQDELFSPDYLAVIEQLKLIVRQTAGGSVAHGAHLSRDAGASLDFRDYRSYQQGDDLRRVDWNVYRRTGGHLFVRRFDQPAPSPVYLLLDNTASMFVESSTRYRAAACVAAAVGTAALRNNDPLAIIPFSPQPMVRNLNGRKSVPHLLHLLSTIMVSTEGSLRHSLDELERRRSRTGIAVIFSDFFEEAGAEELIAQLQRINHRLVLVQIVQPWDADPVLVDSEDLVDSESLAVTSVSPSVALLRHYRKAYQEYQACIEQFVTARRAIHVRIDASAELLPQLEQLFPAGMMSVRGTA